VAIFVDNEIKLLVQGITGREGKFHTRQCIEYGTRVVAGVTPGKGGQTMDDVPVFNSVQDAVRETGANCSMIFVPPAFAANAIMEAVDGHVDVIVAITEGIPALDMMRVKNYLDGKKYNTRPVQDRYHAGRHPQARRSHWRCVPFRDLDL
jgi:succinyl-CoA synthetase alpha subunit